MNGRRFFFLAGTVRGAFTPPPAPYRVVETAAPPGTFAAADPAACRDLGSGPGMAPTPYRVVDLGGGAGFGGADPDETVAIG